MIALIKIGDGDVRGKFFLAALLGTSILPFLKVWWAPSYFGTDGSPSPRPVSSTHSVKVNFWEHDPLWPHRELFSEQSSPRSNCFEKELSVSSSGFNVKETKNSLSPSFIFKSFY